MLIPLAIFSYLLRSKYSNKHAYLTYVHYTGKSTYIDTRYLCELMGGRYSNNIVVGRRAKKAEDTVMNRFNDRGARYDTFMWIFTFVYFSTCLRVNVYSSSLDYRVQSTTQVVPGTYVFVCARYNQKADARGSGSWRLRGIYHTITTSKRSRHHHHHQQERGRAACCSRCNYLPSSK